MPELTTGLHEEAPLQEILGHQPSWVVRWGLTVLLASVLALLYTAWIIQWPEMVAAPIRITAQTPASPVVARNSGKLARWFVEEGREVAEGEPLALLENTADWRDVRTLREHLSRFEAGLADPGPVPEIPWQQGGRLGDLQQAHRRMVEAHSLYRDHLEQGLLERRLRALDLQREQTRQLGRKLELQRDILAQNAALYERKRRQADQLRDHGLLSEAARGDAEGLFLEEQAELQEAESAILDNRIRLAELERARLELEESDRERRQGLRLELQAAFEALMEALASWERRFLLVAPASGQVAFHTFWSEGQFVAADDEVLSILPDLRTLSGRVYLPEEGAGKIEAGQRVQIKFPSYPFREYGLVEGTVDTVAPVVRKRTYAVTVSLPEGLTTTYGKTLRFRHEMEGHAEIITRRLSLLERLFLRLRFTLRSETPKPPSGPALTQPSPRDRGELSGPRTELRAPSTYSRAITSAIHSLMP